MAKYEKGRTTRIVRSVVLITVLLIGVPVLATVVRSPADSWIAQYWWVPVVWAAAFLIYAYIEDLLPGWGVYVDGYNLYHRRLEGTAYKWLNLRALGAELMPGMTINRVRYFTTWAQPRGGDGKQQQRQQAYIRALRTTPGFAVAFGLFRERKKQLQAVFPPPDRHWVYKTEEKGSDVNLAAYLLLDAFRNEYETAL